MPRSLRTRSLLISATILAACCGPGSSLPAQGSESDELANQVQAIFREHCVKCHGARQHESGLRLDAWEGVQRGGDGGAIVTSRAPDASRLMVAITGGSEEVSKMPPDGPPVPAEQVALVRRWIKEGAVTPAASDTAAAASKHWSFRAPRARSIPRGQVAAGSINAIDVFVRARLQSAGLAPSPEAERATLIRRVSLDLLGLPPSREEVADFVADQRPDAYERLVDRLLASPAYGERWGRHWLDAARYADSNGYTRDFGREIWKYRDWVIQAINADMPFDQFTIEQFAGDLLPDATLDQRIATGFHRNTLINEEGGTDQEQFRVDAVADRVATTGEVFLGLTLGCARCHSHKYDPISQKEYYQLFAFLNNCDEPTIEAPSEFQVASGELARRDQIRAEIAGLDKQVEAQRAELEAKQRDWEKSVTPQQRSRLPGPVQVAYDMEFEKRDAANKKIIEDYYRASEQGRRDFPLLDQIAKLRQIEPKIPTTMVMVERQEPRKTFVHRRGNFLEPGEEVGPAVPVVLHPLEDGLVPDSAGSGSAGSGSAGSSGPAGERPVSPPDRLDFARWLVAPSNPLTARVIVNRQWRQFFGQALVDTDNDFGTQGSAPTHPELLDWLAIEFVRSAWSVKQLHRTIVHSATYRQASFDRPELREIDPDNRLLARQNRVRLEAEIIRDMALGVSGLLTNHIGGPSVYPPQPEGVFEFTQDPKPWPTAKNEDRFRRGMYTFLWRSSPYPALTVFDAPNGNVSCTRRLRSNTPMQALTLANDVQFVECAQALARRIVSESSADPGKREDFAFQCCLARLPSATEKQRLRALIDEQLAGFKDRPSAREALLGSDAAQQPGADELAAWTAVCRVLLNLDEFITRE